jgi:hypothetical protein
VRSAGFCGATAMVVRSAHLAIGPVKQPCAKDGA